MASEFKRRRKLTNDEIHALNASAFAADEFEPFVGRIIRPEILDSVVQDGLVEAGPSNRPAVGKVGYRLTSEGWVRFNRLAGRRGLQTLKET
jgi:hypothetical protein